MQGEVRIVDDVPGAFAEVVRDALAAAGGRATLAVSGGATARRCYERLAGTDGVPWERVEVLVGDERFVPVDHEDSNEGMARAALLDRVPVAAVHSMTAAGSTPEEAAAAYQEVVARFDALDVVHLGLGEDAHTASLFPGAAELDETTRLVVAAEHPDHPHPRVTFTFPAIARARLAVVTVEGAPKAEALARVRAGDDVPAARVRAGRVLWLVDPAAGAG